MIVPAAGAVMAIIEGLQAAWGTISRIIAAFAAFMAFLLAVKSGGAGPLFAGVLAAAAVVVLDFVANWLLKKLASAARRVGAKLKGLAEKFKSKRKAKRDAKAPRKHHDDHDTKSPKHSDDHEPKKHDEHDPKKADDAKAQKGKRNRELLEKAQRELPAKIRATLAKGTKGVVLKGRLAIWRLQYRLTSLGVVGSGEQGKIVAKVNPEADLLPIITLHRDELLMYIREVAQEARARSKPEAEKALGTRRTELTASGAEVDRFDFQHPVSPFAIAEATEKAGPLRRGKIRDIGMGDSKVRSTGGWGGTTTSQTVSEFDENGKLVRGGGKYFEIAERYTGRGAELARAIEMFRRSGKVKDGFTSNELTAMVVLLEGVEPGARSSAAGVQTAMTLDLLKNGTPVEDVLGRDQSGGLHPMSPKGAVAEAQKADAFLDPERPRTAGEHVPAGAERHMDREIQLLNAWVNTLDLVFSDMASERYKVEEIKSRIRSRILGL
jgi:voltage-gated potassium channel Kch